MKLPPLVKHNKVSNVLVLTIDTIASYSLQPGNFDCDELYDFKLVRLA